MAFQFNFSHQFIIIILSLAAFLHNILMNGVNNVILSSLQKEFFLTSKETGLYVSVYDIGSLLSIGFISFASARGSKPRWIAFGLIMLFIGCMTVIVPHFIRSDPNESLEALGATADDSSSKMPSLENSIELCNYSVGLTMDEKPFRHTRSHSLDDAQLNQKNEEIKVAKANSWFQLKYLLYLGNTINGFSSASMTTITFAYIEDMAPPRLSAIYESIYYATGAFGVGVGFIITSKFLTIHTDINKAIKLPSWLKTSHPNWIGAWWLPFLLFGSISLLLALVIFTFPQKFSHSTITSKTEQPSPTTKTNGKIKKKKNPSSKKPLKNGDLKNENELVSLNENPNKTDIEKTTVPFSQRHERTSKFLSTLETTGSLLSINQLGLKSSLIDLTNLNDEFDDVEESSSTSHTVTTSQSENNLSQVGSTGKIDTKNLLRDSFSLLKKPVYVLIIIATTIEGLLQNSFLAFAALFLEYQYRLASGTASLVLGLLSIPPLMIGGILSGIIVKRLKYRVNDCLKFLAVVLLVNIVVYAGFMIYCKEPNMIPNLSASQDLSLMTSNSSKNYEIAENCNCNRKIFKPVCLKQSEDIFFQTACLAGCTDFDREKDQFMKCTQEMDTFNLIDQDNSTYSNYFTSGLCPTRDCDFKLVISYMCIFFLMFLNALVFLPYLKVTIGSIDSKEMNPIGLGMKQFFMNGFGTIPGPILFGTVIDSTCTYWHTDQNDQRVCKIYNNQQFAFGFGILGVGFKTLCFILVIVSMVVLKKQKIAKKNNNNEKK